MVTGILGDPGWEVDPIYNKIVSNSMWFVWMKKICYYEKHKNKKNITLRYFLKALYLLKSFSRAQCQKASEIILAASASPSDRMTWDKKKVSERSEKFHRKLRESRYVKFMPFGRFFGWKGRNFTYLEDPGIKMSFYVIFTSILVENPSSSKTN